MSGNWPMPYQPHEFVISASGGVLTLRCTPCVWQQSFGFKAFFGTVGYEATRHVQQAATRPLSPTEQPRDGDARLAAEWEAGEGARPTAEDAAWLRAASERGEIPRRQIQPRDESETP